jgi:hypothetical protein
LDFRLGREATAKTADGREGGILYKNAKTSGHKGKIENNKGRRIQFKMEGVSPAALRETVFPHFQSDGTVLSSSGSREISRLSKPGLGFQQLFSSQLLKYVNVIGSWRFKIQKCSFRRHSSS